LQEAWLTRGALALALLPITALFALLSAARAWFYRRGWLATIRLHVPVVVVGNLIVGGAGKTPTVIAVVELLRRHGFTPGIVAHGYAGSNAGLLEVHAETPASECGDEPKLLRMRTQAPVMVGRDRVAAGHELLRRHPHVNVLVSDDGLQHLRLARDAQVIVFDERGLGSCLPGRCAKRRARYPQRAASSSTTRRKPRRAGPETWRGVRWPEWCHSTPGGAASRRRWRTSRHCAAGTASPRRGSRIRTASSLFCNSPA
jgi:tetraacyldisaccharide-1-P 4'-kinase